VANRNSTELSEEILCQSLTAGQVVYLFVDEDSTTIGGSFTIEVIACTEEAEPNDTLATAGAFTNFIEGSTNTTTDVDFYSLGTPAAGWRHRLNQNRSCRRFCHRRHQSRFPQSILPIVVRHQNRDLSKEIVNLVFRLIFVRLYWQT